MKEAPGKNSREAAAKVARMIGCRGAHEVDGEWMPCATHEELMKISSAAEPKKKDAKGDCGCGGPCCDDEKGIRKRQGPKHRKRWENLIERGVAGIETLEGGGLASKELSDRQQAIYDDLEQTVDEHGKFERGTDADGAHYMPAAKNPFIGEGLVCSNCAFWVGPNKCEIVEGTIQPNAICKLWVIDEMKLENQK